MTAEQLTAFEHPAYIGAETPQRRLDAVAIATGYDRDELAGLEPDLSATARHCAR